MQYCVSLGEAFLLAIDQKQRQYQKARNLIRLILYSFLKFDNLIVVALVYLFFTHQSEQLCK